VTPGRGQRECTIPPMNGSCKCFSSARRGGTPHCPTRCCVLDGPGEARNRPTIPQRGSLPTYSAKREEGGRPAWLQSDVRAKDLLGLLQPLAV
jgi:hypothetical protein